MDDTIFAIYSTYLQILPRPPQTPLSYVIPDTCIPDIATSSSIAQAFFLLLPFLDAVPGDFGVFVVSDLPLSDFGVVGVFGVFALGVVVLCFGVVAAAVLIGLGFRDVAEVFGLVLFQ